MAIHHRIRPSPPLSPFVDAFWLYEGDTPPHATERRLPDGSTTLVINLRDDRMRTSVRGHPDRFQVSRGCVISGPHSTFTVLDSTCLASVMGVQFKPGGGAPFFPLPASELRNEVVSLEVLWGPSAIHLREQLLAADTPARRFHVLEQALLARLAPSRTTHPALAFALRQLQYAEAPTRPAIAAIVDRIGMSNSRFTQLFRNEVGLTPKEYARVLRFQEALATVERGGPAHWGELALACGYFDQSHFIHDFRAFSGMTPGAYLAARGEHRNHVALAD